MQTNRNKKKLSASNLRVYRVICEFIAEHGYSPTMNEVAKIIGCRHVSVFEHVERLRDFGCLIVPPKDRMQRMLVPTKREV